MLYKYSRRYITILEFKNNFLTEIVEEGLPNIKVNKKDAVNKNRRIKVTNMEKEINELIHFEDYKYKGKPMPKIECDEEIEKTVNNEPIKIIDSPLIYANDPDVQKVEAFCDEVIKKYKYEVETHNYLPNDFLIIFPIMKSNVVASELQSKIQEYWVERYDKKYVQYVYLHKHTEGKVINTNDSINATRIMSIRSSKGDGRNVVFILGVTENSLKMVSNKEDGLVYESHLHVSLTRAKKQMYFGLVKNNDDIHERFGKTGYIEYFPKIDSKLKIEKINELIRKDNIINLLEQNDVNFKNMLEEKPNIVQSEMVDWGYHCIKYQTFYYQVILNIINDKNINYYGDKSHLLVTLRKISNYKINGFNVTEYYKYLNKYQYNNEGMPFFPLCELSNKPEYRKYYNKIKNTIQIVQEKIKTNKLNELNVYQSIVLTYMIQIETSQKYSDASPMDIYNITDQFETNKNKEIELLNHIENIRNIIHKSGIQTYENINWNIFKHIQMESKKDYFKISKSQSPIIGNNKTDVIHIVLKSNISNLNYWDIMIEILLERFLIYNPKSEGDKEKFKDKNVITYLFLLDKNSFIKIEWKWDKELIREIKEEIKNCLVDYYKSYNDDIYAYVNNILKTNQNVWENNPDVLIEKIRTKFETHKIPVYILDVLDEIEEEEKYDNMVECECFKKMLDRKLHTYLKRYFR